MREFLLLVLIMFIQFNTAKNIDSSEEDDDSQDLSSEEKDGEIHEVVDEIVPKKDENTSEVKKEKCLNYKAVEEMAACFAGKCKIECTITNLKLAKESSKQVPESCRLGCESQTATFKAAQINFPKTSAELLLGTSMDRCWDECIERGNHLDQTSCISGCKIMRKIQKEQVKSTEKKEDEVNKNRLRKKIKEDVKEKMEEEKVKENKKGEAGANPEEEDKPMNVVRTYIMWDPVGQQRALEIYNSMMSHAQYLFQQMDDLELNDEARPARAGWRDDRRQLRIPALHPRASALTSEGEEVYEKVTNSLGSFKDRVLETLSSPEFKQSLFYCLLTICCFLLLLALYDNCVDDSKEEDDEEEVILPEKGVMVKLPSYEECIMADKYPVKDMKNEKEIRVDVDMESVHTPSKETEEKSEEESLKI